MARLGISFQTDRPLTEYSRLGELLSPYPFETLSVYEDLLYQSPWPALFQLALHTERGLLGPGVTNPYTTHPVVTASNLALLDEASGGRAYLGVGKGAFLGAIELPQPRPLRAIRETVELVQRILTGERVPYEGELFRASREAYLRFPIPGRRLPVLIGTWGPKTCALAGQIADMVKIGGSANPDSAPVFRRHIEAGARRAGRDATSIRLVYGTVTVVDPDRKVAEALARRRTAMYVGAVGELDPTFAMDPEELERVRKFLASGDEEAAGRALSAGTLRRFSCFGTPDDVVRKVSELFDAGVDLFEFGAPHGVDQAEAIRLLGEKVLPAFADS